MRPPAVAPTSHCAPINGDGIRHPEKRIGLGGVPQPAPRAEDDPPVKSWRDRLDRANAAVREAEVQRLAGELLPRGAVLHGLNQQRGAVRARMLAIPNRAVGRIASKVSPELALELDALLTELIYEALTEMSEADVALING